jgi:hypothetical protein
MARSKLGGFFFCFVVVFSGAGTEERKIAQARRNGVERPARDEATRLTEPVRIECILAHGEVA